MALSIMRGQLKDFWHMSHKTRPNKIDLDAIIDEARTGDTPLEELQASNEKMRKRLENIGEANPTAIEMARKTTHRHKAR